ncbi:MAG TPA: hypothetical protein VIF62_32380 [Labilithrix sp.]
MLRRSLSVLILVACSSSSSSPGSSSGSDASSPAPPPSGGGNAPSTADERSQLCNLAIPKCPDLPYGDVGNCIDDQQAVAECYAKSMIACLSKLTACANSDYDSCQTEGAHACSTESVPQFVTDCKAKADGCGFSLDVQKNCEDSCDLLPALDDSGRTRGAQCVAGTCDALEKCLVELTP